MLTTQPGLEPPPIAYHLDSPRLTLVTTYAMFRKLYLLCALLAFLVSPTYGARLLLIPINMNSHVQMLARFGVALAEEGHMTVMVVPSNARVPAWARESKMEIWQFPGDHGEPYSNSEANSRLLVKAALSDSAWERLDLMLELTGGMAVGWERDCEHMFADADTITKVKDARFDLAIMDLMGGTCNYVLPYGLGIPIASYSILTSAWIYRVPALPSFVPNMMSDATDHMTFTERLLTFVTEMAEVAMANQTGADYYLAKYAPNRPKLTLLDLLAQSVFWFLVEDIAVGYPTPTMPNTVKIGDVLTSPAKPLPGDLEDFVTSATDGVVVVSFGSYLDHLPPETVTELCKAFKQIPQKTVWKLKAVDQCQEKDKIKTMKWIPQNDLLGHPKVKLLVTHAGLNSMIEAVYHATPVVAIPLVLDQPYNAQFMTSRGLGDQLNLRDLSADDLVTKIQTVIRNGTIEENMKRHSQLLRDKPETPGRRASFWINHVLQYGDDHLRSGAFELSIPQFFMMDIFLFMFTSLMTMIVLVCVCATCTYRCCKRQLCSRQTKEKLKKS